MDILKGLLLLLCVFGTFAMLCMAVFGALFPNKVYFWKPQRKRLNIFLNYFLISICLFLTAGFFANSLDSSMGEENNKLYPVSTSWTDSASLLR